MVNTGDQAFPSVSRQIAPCAYILACAETRYWGITYRLAADIRVPDLGVKLHDWRSKGIVIGNSDIYFICASLVRCLGWTCEKALQMRNVVWADSVSGDIG